MYNRKMSKSGTCPCGQTVTIPKSECLFECHRCSKASIFLCHVLQMPKDLMHMRCKECKTVYSMYTCPQCQAYAVIKGFQSGRMYNCPCGFQATMLACNRCNCLLCLPTRNNYEMTKIQCKKCQWEFRFRLCPQCQQCNYLGIDQKEGDGPLCFNEQCQLFQQRLPKEPVKTEALPQKAAQINPYEQMMMPQQKQETKICNICLDRQKSMINTTCYHVSVCQPCSKGLEGRCPICRRLGDYKKVLWS